jgi:hypothetical protein
VIPKFNGVQSLLLYPTGSELVGGHQYPLVRWDSARAACYRREDADGLEKQQPLGANWKVSS